jgi:hypothetical protein
MKKALIITYYWPPSGGSGVQRWLKFAKYLPEFGWEPIIYTPENPDMSITDMALLNDVSPDLKVLKKPIWEPYGLARLFKKKGAAQNTGVVKEQGSWIQKLSLWIRGNVFLPDPRVYWVKPSISYLISYLKSNPVDVIITTGPPHSMHLIGLGLKEKLGVKWVADFRDPWSKLDFFKKYKMTKSSKNKHLKLESQVLQKADLCLTVSKYWENDFKALGANRTACITNGYDDDDFVDYSPNKEDCFIIGHFGLLNSFRSSPALWSSLDSICEENDLFKEKLEIRLCGVVDNQVLEQISKYNHLSSRINYKGYLSHSEIIKEYEQSALLLLLLNDSDIANGHLPGKLFEYLKCRKPVLALGLEKSDVSEILDATQCGSVCGFDDSKEIKKVILNAFDSFVAQKREINNEEILKYSRNNLSKVLAKTLDKLF